MTGSRWKFTDCPTSEQTPITAHTHTRMDEHTQKHALNTQNEISVDTFDSLARDDKRLTAFLTFLLVIIRGR